MHDEGAIEASGTTPLSDHMQWSPAGRKAKSFLKTIYVPQLFIWHTILNWNEECLKNTYILLRNKNMYVQ